MTEIGRSLGLRVLPTLLITSLLSGCLGACERPPATIPGPERTDLAAGIEGTILVTRPVGGAVAIELPGLEEATIRVSDRTFNPVRTLSGPDAFGRIAFIQGDGERHSLRTINRDGTGERELFSRPGNSISDKVIGKHIGLSPDTGRVAFFSDIRLQRIPGHSWRVGQLELIDISTGAEIPIEGTGLSDRPLAWFPDGVHLALCDLVDRSVGADLIARHLGPDSDYAQYWMQWEQIPAVFVVNTQTGSRELIFPGIHAVVSTDGRSLLIGGPSYRNAFYDLERQTAREVTLPGFTDGPYALVDGSKALYMGLMTTGQAAGYTKNNSPLVGRKPMRTLKLADLDAGGFQTVVESIDPRTDVSFGR